MRGPARRRPVAAAGWVVALLLVIAPVPAAAHGPQTPEDYRWVRAPAGIDTQGKAAPARVTYGPELFAGGQALAWTPDLQSTVAIAVPIGQRAAATDIAIAPLDPETLAALPESVTANGNAYRVTIATDGWTPEVQVRLRTPYPPTALWVLEPDGSWTDVPGEVVPPGEIVGPVPVAPGVVVLASWEPPTHTWVQRLAHRPALIVGASVVAGGAGWVIGRRRS